MRKSINKLGYISKTQYKDKQLIDYLNKMLNEIQIADDESENNTQTAKRAE